jgi:hypothetical protein
MKRYASKEFPRRLTWKPGIMRGSCSNATQIKAEVPPAFTIV